MSSRWASRTRTTARRHVAALVLIVEPGRPHRINPDLVATTLDLTPAETQVAVWLAEGKRVRDMAKATGQWYRLAAEQGHAGAQERLGWAYAAGRGVLKDYVQAHTLQPLPDVQMSFVECPPK